MPDMEKSEILERVKRATDSFTKSDLTLLDIDVNERSMTHRLAEHLQKEFPSEEWFVDCEYNRHFKRQKKLLKPPNLFSSDEHWRSLDAPTVYPDIIVHKRMTDEENLLVIEAKKSTSRVDDRWDRTKLAAFKEWPYSYQMAIFVRFKVGADKGIDFEVV